MSRKWAWMSNALFSIGVWCFAKAGYRADHIEALVEAQQAAERAEIARNAAVDAKRAFDDLMKSAKLADGLLALGEVDAGHQALRVGIIHSRGIATTRRPKPALSGESR